VRPSSVLSPSACCIYRSFPFLSLFSDPLPFSPLLGYRARSAPPPFRRFDLFSNVRNAVNLCAAPGSWSQVLLRQLKYALPSSFLTRLVLGHLHSALHGLTGCNSVIPVVMPQDQQRRSSASIYNRWSACPAPFLRINY
jgi:hypothetical protein